MKKTTILSTVIITCVIALYFIFNNKDFSKKSSQILLSTLKFKCGSSENPQKRIEWEFNRLKDPATGRIPEDIRRKELEFAKTLPNDAHLSLKSVQWIPRGPYNVGGRTRGAALDVNDENTIIAGGVSGGIWRSTNLGASWTKVTTPYQLHNVTCLAQDTRPGKTNVWYYGTGEAYGNSASSSYSAFFLGNGIFKSTDNGLIWSSLSSTASNTPHGFDNNWDLVWNIVTDPSNDTADVVYSATYGCIFHSNDGGNSWTEQLSGGSYFTDIAVSSNGIVYATLSSDGSQKGIWRSDDGLNWTEITSDSFPSVYDRIVIGINPSNENEVYFLAVTPNSGQHSDCFFGYEEWNSLWKYTYLSGDGADSNGIWTDLSMNIPAFSDYPFDNFYAQGSYNLVIKVKPDEPNVVFIGGTNLYRSTDGFTTPDNTTQIGGYKVGSIDTDWDIYETHHPDQHGILFLPSNPDIMISATDGGMFKTNNCLESTVSWETLNNGYLTTQLYTVSVDQSSTNDIIVAGFQDNGNFFTNSASPTANWVMPLNGDGSFSAITNGGDYYYLSIQMGKVFKITLDNDGNPTNFARIDPIGVDKEDYQFINPFALDPNNNGIMYLAGGHKLWRNDSLFYIPLAGNIDSISMGWFPFTDSVGNYITAVTVSKNPPNIVYYGTNSKFVYRIDSADVGDPEHIRVTSLVSFPSANVSCIAVDPGDADKVMVVFSNYNVKSLFFSKDGGQNWENVSGNLEQFSHGGGNGPSCRWASILPVNDKTIYFVGTSTGLYATDTLKGLSTVWTQIGANTIGNVVVEMVKTREADGLVVVATHGNGVYSTHINSIDDIFGLFVNIDVTPANCDEYNDGSITINTTYGTPPLQYSIDGGNTFYYDSVFTDLYSGTYYVVVMDANNNTMEDTIVIKGPVNLGDDITIYTDQTYTLDAGQGFATYFWSDASANQTLIVDGSVAGTGTHTYYVVVTDTNGCVSSDTILITVNESAGVDNIIANNIINLYPNPTKRFVNLEIQNTGKEELFIEILDISGKIIYSKRYENITTHIIEQIDLSYYSKGIYYVKVRCGNSLEVEKIIVY